MAASLPRLRSSSPRESTAMAAVNYLSDSFKVAETTRDDCKPYGQAPSGYGRKIATPHKIKLAGEKRWRRVYAVCFSNAASHYVLINGSAYYIRGELD